MRLVITEPDDFHLHLRDGGLLAGVAPESARHFARALVMPNLVPPVITGADAARYRARIRAALPEGARFEPLLTLYLTEATAPETVLSAHAAGMIAAVKLYPAGATTHSDAGVKSLDRVRPVLEAMAAAGIPLCIHGEVTDPEVDIFDREAVFIERVLEPLRRALPELKIVLEHLTTCEAVAYVQSAGPGIAGTITVHHLYLNRNHVLAGGIRPHFYCLPVAKREIHRRALLEAATSGKPCFFLGTDSAPHPDAAKLAPCGCAGCFTAPVAMPLLAQAFEEAGALARLEPFTSHFGADFYGLPRNMGRLILERRDEPLALAPALATPAGPVTIFNPGLSVFWHVLGREPASP